MILFCLVCTYLKLQRRSTSIMNSLVTCQKRVRPVAFYEPSSAQDRFQGVLVRHTDPGGLTWEQYEIGIEAWRAEHDKHVTPPPDNKNVIKIAHFNDVYQVSNQKVKVLM
jgi:hypothetical protein